MHAGNDDETMSNHDNTNNTTTTNTTNTDPSQRSRFFRLKNVESPRIVEALVGSGSVSEKNSDEKEDESIIINLAMSSPSPSMSISVKENTVKDSSVHDGSGSDSDAISPSPASYEEISTALPEVESHGSHPSLSSPSTSATLPASVSASHHDDVIVVSPPQEVGVMGEPVGESLLEKEKDVSSSSPTSTHPLNTTLPDTSAKGHDISSQDNTIDVTSGAKATSKVSDSPPVNHSTPPTINSTPPIPPSSKSDVKGTTEPSKAPPLQKASATASTAIPPPPVVSEQQQQPSPQPQPQSQPQPQPNTSKNKTVAAATTPSPATNGGSGGASGGPPKTTGGGEGGSSSNPPPPAPVSSMVYPIDAHRGDILRSVQRDRVTIVAGNTPVISSTYLPTYLSNTLLYIIYPCHI